MAAPCPSRCRRWPRGWWWSFDTGAAGDLPTLALDAGHGGADPGALSRGEDVYERDINRAILDRLQTMLAEHEGSLRVVVTAEEGETKKPVQRAEVAQEAGADLLVSLHLNSDSSPKVRGFECYAQPPQHPHNAVSRGFAESLAKRVAEETKLPVRGSKGVFYCYYVPSGGGYRQEIIDAKEAERFGHPGAATFGLLENAGCPAVLVEQWYLSSAEDMKLCHNEAFMDKMAVCLYRAICKYFGLNPQY